MSTFAFAAASATAFLWFVVHLFIGGREVARPLRAADLPDLVRDTQYLCWHFTTVAIVGMSAMFGLAAVTGETAYAVAGTLLAAGFAVTGIGLIAAIGQSHARFPQGWLFVPVAAFGLVGLW